MIGHIHKGSRRIETSAGQICQLDRRVSAIYNGYYEFYVVRELPATEERQQPLAIMQPLYKSQYHLFLEELSFDAWRQSIGGIPTKSYEQFVRGIKRLLRTGYVQFDSTLLKSIYAASKGILQLPQYTPADFKDLYSDCMNCIQTKGNKTASEAAWKSAIEGSLGDPRTVALTRYIRTGLLKCMGNQTTKHSKSFLYNLYTAWMMRLPDADLAMSPFQLYIRPYYIGTPMTVESLKNISCPAIFASGQRERVSLHDVITKYSELCVSHAFVVNSDKDQGALVCIVETAVTMLRDDLISLWKPRLRILEGNVTFADPVTGKDIIPDKYRKAQ